MKARHLRSLLFCLVVAGCQGSSAPGDGGTQDGKDGEGQPDLDLDGEIGLQIEAGTRGCSLNPAYLDGLDESFAHKVRIVLRPGLVRWSSDQERFEYDLIERVEAGADKAVAVADGPGVFVRSVIDNGPGNAIYRFQYSQSFLWGGQSLTLSAEADYETVGGVIRNALLTVGNDPVSWDLFSASVVFAEGFNVSLGPCVPATGPGGTYRLEIQGGHSFKFQKWNHCPFQYVECKSTPGNLIRASFTRGGVEQTVDDPFRLLHSMAHHDWGQSAAARFDPVVDGVYGVFLQTPGYPDYHTFTEIQYLSSDLQVLETRAVTSQTVGDW